MPDAASHVKWDVNDVVALAALGALTGPYVAWNAWSMRPSAVATIVNEIVLNERRSVVELGCGASTVFIARALRETGGALVTVEQDEEWAAALRQRLDREDLAGVVDVVHAPLVPLADVSERGAPLPSTWFDRERLDPRLPATIDVLVVDGPAAHHAPDVLVRHPALPLLADRLAPACCVVLDDANRPAEQETARRWAAGSDLELTEHPSTGLAVLRRGPGVFAAF